MEVRQDFWRKTICRHTKQPIKKKKRYFIRFPQSLSRRPTVPRGRDPFGQHQVSIFGADQKDRGLWGREWKATLETPYVNFDNLESVAFCGAKVGGSDAGKLKSTWPLTHMLELWRSRPVPLCRSRRLRAVSLYQSSFRRVQRNPKTWAPGAILRAARNESASLFLPPFPQVPLGSFFRLSLAEHVPVLSLPGRLTEKGLLTV